MASILVKTLLAPITGHPMLVGLRLGCSWSCPCFALCSSLHPWVSQHILVTQTD